MIRRQPPLVLLGEGLDAIVQHTAQPPSSWLVGLIFGNSYDPALPVIPTAAQRMERYLIAALLYPADSDYRATERRFHIGAQYKHAWTCGRFPNLTRVHLAPRVKPQLRLVVSA